MLRPGSCAEFFVVRRAPGRGARRAAAAALWLGMAVALPQAHAQAIAAGALGAAAIPVDHPAALLLLALAIAACMAWMLHRKGRVASSTLRSMALGAGAVVVGAAAMWGDGVRAQLQELQRAFSQPGQTLPIPVQDTGTAPGGSPLGFLPVVYANQASTGLRITSITRPAWSTCFPLGIPSPLPVTPARPGTVCAVNTPLSVGSACWVDVAALCADAAASAQGSQPSSLQNDTASVLAGAQATGNVLANDQDADGPLVVASFVYQGTRYAAGASAMLAGLGTLTLQGNGAYTFVAASPFTGASPLVVSYTVHTGASSSLQISVTAPPANRAPVANDDTATTDENSSVIVAVRSNDTDADGDSLTVTGVTQGANGSVVIDAVTRNPVYTPNAGFTGTDSFTYTVSDNRGGVASAAVTVTVNALINQAPVAANDSALTPVNTPISIPVSVLLGNDTDPEGGALTVVSVQAPVHGTVSLMGVHVVFTPTGNFEGLASFTYTIEDPLGASSTANVNVAVGSATAPSVVVMRALVVNAHGTGGTSAPFPITTKLVDTDGSESLTIKVSNVPTGVSFNAGVNLGGGVWQFTEADLPQLSINLPGSYTTNANHLTVQVTSTEASGGATASVSTVVTLRAAYTTVDITTTNSGSYTGSSASEFVQGGSGNNTINASSGNNIVDGGDGDDNLSAGAGADMLYGGDGDDVIDAGSGPDVISGGPGNDTLTGGAAGENFVDVFVWSLGDQGAAGTPAVDTILNFATAAAGSSTAGGDVLNLRDLLQGESAGPANGAGNLANYLHFDISGGNTVIHISHTGGFGADSHTVGASYTSAAETQRIVLSGVNLQSLYSGATTDQQIITQLLNNNKLIVD